MQYPDRNKLPLDPTRQLPRIKSMMVKIRWQMYKYIKSYKYTKIVKRIESMESLNRKHYLNDITREAAKNAAKSDFPDSIIEKVKETPAFLVSEVPLRRNLEILSSIKKATGAKILLALKAFAMYRVFPIMAEYLDGVCASGPFESRLGREYFKKEVHTFGPAYSESDIEELIKSSDTIIFNSLKQWKKYREKISKSGRKIEIGLRVNPEYSEIKTDLYNPAYINAGLGILSKELEGEDLKGIDGLHFHVLCENNADALANVLEHFERLYGKYIHQMKWINFGGGHHIARADYDIKLLIKLINNFKKKYGVEVYLEPGEGIVLNTGILISSVLDIVHEKEGLPIAILDTSAETHMPDVLAMPYSPDIINAGAAGEKKNTYRLRGLTCLAGDIIGDYSFEEKLKPNDKIVFLDMALYTMVKTTTFNGVKLPSILFLNSKSGDIELVKRFGFESYKEKLS